MEISAGVGLSIVLLVVYLPCLFLITNRTLGDFFLVSGLFCGLVLFVFLVMKIIMKNTLKEVWEYLNE